MLGPGVRRTADVERSPLCVFIGADIDTARRADRAGRGTARNQPDSHVGLVKQFPPEL